MLVRINKFSLQDRRRLLQFLRHPYSNESCARVDAALPLVGGAYRAFATAWPLLKSANFTSQADRPEDVFEHLGALDADGFEAALFRLLKIQVILLEEELRDHAEAMKRQEPATMHDIDLPKSEAICALRAMSLHEAVFMVFAGLFQVDRVGQLLNFSLTSAGDESLRNRVLTTTIQNFSDASIRAMLMIVIERARKNTRGRCDSVIDGLSSSVLDEVEARFLDAYFAINSRIATSIEIAPLIRRVKMLCRWFAVLEMVRLAGERSLTPSSKRVTQLNLSLSLVDEVIEDRASALQSDKGIYRTAEGNLTLDGSSVGHSITVCKAVVLDQASSQKIGKLFERKIADYIQESVSTDDYIVRPGFKKSGKDQGGNYDCDIVIFEPLREKIFFVQAKWKRDARTANLDDELCEWTAKNSPLTHGAAQLTGLRDRLMEPGILAQIRTSLRGIRLTDEHIATHSEFVVLHTLPFFSAYAQDGVLFYEWNLFRNLLRRGEVQRIEVPERDWSRARPVETVTRAGILPLEKPERVLLHVCEPFGLNMKSFPDLMNARTHAQYGFTVRILGANWLKRITKRDQFRIARPYL